MTLTPFTPDELAAWIEEELGDAADYELRPDELTVTQYHEVLGVGEVSRKVAADRLEVMVKKGKMRKHRQKVDGHWVNIYRRLPEEDGNGDEVADRADE